MCIPKDMRYLTRRLSRMKRWILAVGALFAIGAVAAHADYVIIKINLASSKDVEKARERLEAQQQQQQNPGAPGQLQGGGVGGPLGGLRGGGGGAPQMGGVGTGGRGQGGGL